ncbi:MAG: DUF503 domain-containing protein [Candidatus Omnitrophica bacterium]|nr:DUF503 domain-containing protein [Candidatus Omnitrophota bacterium]
MTIGILRLELFIPESSSLKEKRFVLHSLKARLRNNFNVALAQIGDEDKWQKATFAIVGVERDRRSMDSTLSKVIDFVEDFSRVQLINHETELL